MSETEETDAEFSAYIGRDQLQEDGPSADAVCRVVGLIERYGMIDGAHHKQWLLDQALRGLLPYGRYDLWREAFDADAEATDYAPWDEGIAP